MGASAGKPTRRVKSSSVGQGELGSLRNKGIMNPASLSEERRASAVNRRLLKNTEKALAWCRGDPKTRKDLRRPSVLPWKHALKSVDGSIAYGCKRKKPVAYATGFISPTRPCQPASTGESGGHRIKEAQRGTRRVVQERSRHPGTKTGKDKGGGGGEEGSQGTSMFPYRQRKARPSVFH